MKTVSTAGLVLASLFAALVLGEIGCRIFLNADSTAEYREVIRADEKPEGQRFPKHFVSRKYQPKRAHPYLGYVYNDALVDGINSEGFRDLHQLPYLHGQDEFVIGVFGGSFASDFAESQEFKAGGNYTDFAARLRSLDPKRFGNKKITVLNFGLAAGRQPQQYFAISLFLDSLDMVIVIDGFNEAFRSRELDFPVYFPNYSQFLFSKSNQRFDLWSEIFNLRKRQRAWAETILSNRLLRSSKIMFYTWRAYGAYVEKRMAALVSAEKPTDQFPENIALDEYNRQKAAIWSKYTQMQALVLRGLRIPYVHVLQPNQHLPGTKPLSEEETEKFMWRRNPNLETTLKTYALILNEQKTLNKQGFRVTDFTTVFKDHPETIYRDKCCHINDHGMDIFEQSLALETVKVLGLNRPR